MTQISQDAFEYLNKIRQNPSFAISKLQEYMKLFKGNTLQKPGEIPLLTNEGPKCVYECIQFLQSQNPLRALQWSDGLALAAQDHVQDIGPKGIAGHTGSDGSSMSDRIERHGEWNGTIGENIGFGSSTGEDVILQLIIDDGVNSRGHRKNCFKGDFGFVGISDGIHQQYKTMCVLDFAGEFTEKNNKLEQVILAERKEPISLEPQKKQKEVLKKKATLTTKSQVSMKNGKKIIQITKTYTFQDGSTKVDFQTYTET